MHNITTPLSCGCSITTTPSLLSAKGLSFETGGSHLIQNVDIDILEGSRVVIMGANGAGKSLLLRLLHGLLPKNAGSLVWRGNPMDAAALKEQAMVFQRPVLLRRSVVSNLRFALSSRGIRGKEREACIDKALALAHLTDLASRPARVLSGGEQQRLALARALAMKPRLLFLDEPTASLDPASTFAIEQLVLDTNAQGTTIVMVTHDRGQAKRVGQDIVFLHEGSVVETAPVSQFMEAPRSEEAKAWLEGKLLFRTNQTQTSL